jgi:hypothetical protein
MSGSVDMIMDIEDHLHVAVEIASAPADIETLDTYEHRVGHYQSRNYIFLCLKT